MECIVLFTEVSTNREKEARSSVSFEPAGFNEFCPAPEPKGMNGNNSRADFVFASNIFVRLYLLETMEQENEKNSMLFFCLRLAPIPPPPQDT